MKISNKLYIKKMHLYITLGNLRNCFMYLAIVNEYNTGKIQKNKYINHATCNLYNILKLLLIKNNIYYLSSAFQVLFRRSTKNFYSPFRSNFMLVPSNNKKKCSLMNNE